MSGRQSPIIDSDLFPELNRIVVALHVKSGLPYVDLNDGGSFQCYFGFSSQQFVFVPQNQAFLP
jgi:hypothetical protein